LLHLSSNHNSNSRTLSIRLIQQGENFSQFSSFSCLVICFQDYNPSPITTQRIRGCVRRTVTNLHEKPRPGYAVCTFCICPAALWPRADVYHFIGGIQRMYVYFISYLYRRTVKNIFFTGRTIRCGSRLPHEEVS
jgi:hypothetical protein